MTTEEQLRALLDRAVAALAWDHNAENGEADSDGYVCGGCEVLRDYEAMTGKRTTT